MASTALLVIRDILVRRTDRLPCHFRRSRSRIGVTWQN
jgi:hypothetical protein